MKEKKSMSSEELSRLVVEGMTEKKATDVVILDLRNVKGAVADFFVIGTGNSDTQVDAIADSIDEHVYKNIQEDPWHREGRENKEWVLLDYVNVVAHVFKRETRDFFALEDLWGDAEITYIEEKTQPKQS
ncbi:ribosome silencing factor [Xanthovirga aplysinae]|uniref:ribosome silencing factor n=1 Tax=Xanthovirga aplysinae TaxID=2529853 RepID=UPI0012BBDD5C|nr:ribosome silencing factor [Xanthovirga aplysinae]MTI32304.1 ribosome silencing factor [Xanthovirga aplysinae]